MQYSVVVLGATGNVGGRIVQLLIKNPLCKKLVVVTRRKTDVFTASKVVEAVVNMDRLDEEGTADYVLLDHENVRVGGHAGTRRLTTHATPANESVTTESWSTVVDGRRVTLTANVGTLRLSELSGLIDTVAASLVVNAPGGVPA